MSSRSQSITSFITEHVITDSTSWEIQELINQLPEKYEEAAGVFCDWFELGDWFYESMITNEVDISDVLIDFAESRRQEEEEATVAQAEIERDLRVSQGVTH